MAQRFLIWFWSGGGGGSLFAVNLARRLSLRFGAENVALSLRADDPTLTRALSSGLDVRAAEIVSDRRRPLETIRSLAHSASVLAEHARDADVVIVPMNFAAAAPLSAMLRQPMVYCAHDPAPHPGDYAPVLQWTTQSLLLGRAKRVVALSHYAADLLRRRGVGKKLVVAPLASVFEPRPPAIVEHGPTRLLFVGRMIAYKGLDLLAVALDRIAARDDWRLTIAGHGPALDEAMARRFAHPQIERLERTWLDDAALEALIASSDILLAPYRSATQSGVVAQAMAAGRPCIVTPVGALPEQVGAGGRIAKDASAEGFAQALALALDDRDARTVKAAAALAQAEAAWRADHWGWLAQVS
jgi:glycosyltransferase involved in cell wall biosynthesis